MLTTGLEFAPGTTDECKQLVGKMFPPAAILSAYRTARAACKTGDIVLVASDQSPDISGGTRREYAAHLKKTFGARASEFGMWAKSAHSVVKLPPESEAMWLVVEIRRAVLPVMCVLFTLPYDTATGAH